MKKFLESLISFFQKKEKQPPKIKVCWDFLAGILGKILFLTDEQVTEFMKLDDHDPKVLREIIQGICRHYRYFLLKIRKNSEIHLHTIWLLTVKKLEWVFPSHQIPLTMPLANFSTP